MSDAAQNEQKVQVTIRVEPGSLGPDGLDHVEDFCRVAQCYFDKLYVGTLCWQVIPRYDKSLAEIEYCYLNRTLNEAQANKMLSLINKDIDSMDEETMQHIANLIDKFLGHQY
ncbi:hypothetical protein J1N51_02255 [Psychrosphaera ytuae]|uniref:Uncharacterized protein n=1 Tax=Psychrosphaera ytuae TaxID=2820710 RepID=A0A975DCQ6_9GAMM|nr:hypothetical protein [Psychrosphaera ytuae]QTH64329.1 hypothetical protein J1N51_02255 [Psychrosphaera ytuae]